MKSQVINRFYFLLSLINHIDIKLGYYFLIQRTRQHSLELSFICLLTMVVPMDPFFSWSKASKAFFRTTQKENFIIPTVICFPTSRKVSVHNKDQGVRLLSETYHNVKQVAPCAARESVGENLFLVSFSNMKVH